MSVSNDPYLNFLPLFTETLARVRLRMDADANAGLATTDPGYLDTREGTFYWDVTQTAALEIVRLWDSLGSETPAAAFPSVAWGSYLDNHAATFGLLRNPAVAAVTTVAVYAPLNTVVAAGSQFSAPPSDPSLDTIDFASTQSATAAPQLFPPTGLSASATQSGGALAAATYYYTMSTVGIFGQTIASSVVNATITSSAGQITLTWTDANQAQSYNIFRSTSAGTPGSLIASISPAGTVTTFTDNGSAVPQSAFTSPTVDGTICAVCPVVAVIAGSSGNLAAGAINTLETTVTGATNVVNYYPTTGGADPEDDEDLRARILAQYTGQGSGTIAFYQQVGLAYPGIEEVAVIPLWNGPGTVLVIPYQTGGSPVTAAIVSGLQSLLDPQAGLGHGQAPIGATVTVVTTSPLAVNVVATVKYQTGYSLTGAGGTVATQSAILNALTAYLSSLQPGNTLVYQQVQAAFFVDGVLETTGLTVNGGTSDIVLTVNPAQTAQLGTVTLS